MKKKALITCICVILLASLTIVAIAVNANSRSYAIDREFAETGTDFTVPISIKNNSGIVSLRFRIVYDEDVLELINVSDTGLLNGYTTPSPDIASPYTLRWADALATENNTASGEAAVATFRVKENVQTDKTTVTIEHIEARPLDGTNVDFDNISKKIELKNSHSFTDYVSDNNATCTKNGTKTAYCDYGCGQSVKQIDYYTALGHTDADTDDYCDVCYRYIPDADDEEIINCPHICHKKGILRFVAKLVTIIWKLFKVNPVCECGAAHY